MKIEKFNLPGSISRYFIESKLTILLILALLCFGSIGLVLTPREENPQIIVPAAEITVALPGATPVEVEHLVLSPLEAIMASIDGVKHVYGTALEGMAIVALEFEVGEDKDNAIVRVYDRIFRHKPHLPPGAEEPVIQAIDIDDVPVFTVTLSSEHYSDHELRRIAERLLEHLRGVKGVGVGYIVGGLPREIRIETQPERLLSYGISIDQLASVIRNAGIDVSLGNRVYQQENRSLRIDSFLKDAQQIEKLIVQTNGNQIIRVSDLARVIYDPPVETSQMTRFAFGMADSRFSLAGEPENSAATLAIAKKKGVNAVKLTDELRQRIHKMDQGFLPPDVNVVITRDDGIKADQTVTQLIEHLFIAIGAVAIILLIFLGRWAALIVSITIPLVFSVVIGADLMAGPTLNRITLYALILGLGMLVDDAIVVIENIHRYFDLLPANADKATRARAAVIATAEIGNPTTLATFTVVTVFLSLLLVTGMLGEFFYPVAFNVPVAMIASLFIAYSVTPWLARRWMLTAIDHDGSNKGELLRGEEPQWLQNKYRKIITLFLNHTFYRRLFYLLVAGFLAASFLQPAWQFIRPQGITGAVSPLGIPLAFLPKDNKNTFLVHVHLPENTPLEITDRAAREIGEQLRQQPIVLNYEVYVGLPSVIDFNGQLRGRGKQVGSQFADIRVNLINKFERSESSIDLVLSLRPEIEKIAARYPGGLFQLIEDPPGPPVRATVLAEVYGPDLEVLDQLTKQLESEFVDTYDVVEVETNIPTDVKEYRFSFLRDKVALAKLDPAKVSRVLGQLMQGEVLGYAHTDGERMPVPIKLHIPRQHRIDPDMLERAFITNPEGKRIPLSELIKIELKTKLKPINHKDSERVHYIGGELTSSAPVYAVLDLDNRIDQMKVTEEQHLETANLKFSPVRANTLEGYKVLWDGELRLTLDAFRDMGMALGMALLGIYLLMVGYYRSFSLPLLAMTAVPLALIGVFPAHLAFGVSFSAASMVGVIALAGVVVRNSLLIIDFIQDYQKQGYEINDAVREAGAIRLRPILLTTLAIALGTAIMVPDAVFGGLALALIFGSISSALLVVIIVPLLYRRMMKVKPVNNHAY